ncbi:NADH dehydrogenase/NADH:ubiquinone oxidoreductase 75 kD subunit [Longilinea arvoryzae]|uniref:NADH dehydrogenase/NADH:ubiquinone oxidoreductase 75 kD subunit n=1 Tax=Longilinea arvoryzae TaxID=360412 RepID=A0A0S7B8M5_9CHLR|nr:2Fe-2S iron-sulfur cluster-binding protein [Longilinea arvoryzae]GAP13703.1 NADH dehydrogenase/NADH:ubiquinone oxidoreductase 75 kD subunit [Longilinea arvoryzae]
MISLTIDDKSIRMTEGRTLLEACREHGIPIPTLCYHPALEPYGACRLCMVELDLPQRPPRLVAACVYPCEEGQVVRTNTELVQKSRRMTAELLLAGAGQVPEIRELAAELGVQEVRFRLAEENACVLCGLCVRACKEIVGVAAISLIERGMAKKVSAPFQLASSRCIGCGTCVLICPTGAFKFEEVAGAHNVEPTLEGYRRGYYRASGEVDLRPNFVQDLTALLRTPAEPDEPKA